MSCYLDASLCIGGNEEKGEDLSYGDRLEVKKEDNQNSCMLYLLQQLCAIIRAQMCYFQ